MSAYLNPADLPPVLEIEITADDIAHGDKTECQTCPAARALCRAYPLRQPMWWSVLGPYVHLHYGNGIGLKWHPEAALTDWVNRFDAGKPVTPGKFTLTEAVA